MNATSQTANNQSATDPNHNQQASKHAEKLAKDSNDDDLINLSAVWTLTIILASILVIMYLAYLGNQVEIL